MNIINQYTDPSITNEQLDNLTSELVRAKLERDKEQEWEQFLREEMGFQRPTRPLRIVSSRLKKWMAIAASLLLPIIAYFFLLKPPPTAEQLADRFIAEEKMPSPQARKGAMDISTLQQNAIDAYNKKEYEAANAHWGQLEQANQMREEDYLLYGFSHLQLKQYDGAVNNFLKVKTFGTNGGKFRPEATWYLALAYVKNGQVDLAVAELKEVAKEDWRREKALELLTLLKK